MAILCWFGYDSTDGIKMIRILGKLSVSSHTFLFCQHFSGQMSSALIYIVIFGKHFFFFQKLFHHQWNCSFCHHWNCPKKICFSATRFKIDSERKRFISYMIYAWGLPFILTLITVILDSTELLPDRLLPGIGTTTYFLKSPEGSKNESDEYSYLYI